MSDTLEDRRARDGVMHGVEIIDRMFELERFFEWRVAAEDYECAARVEQARGHRLEARELRDMAAHARRQAVIAKHKLLGVMAS